MTWLNRITNFMQKLPDPNDESVTFTSFSVLTSISKETGEPMEESARARLFISDICIGEVLLQYTIFGTTSTTEPRPMIHDTTPAEQFDA